MNFMWWCFIYTYIACKSGIIEPYEWDMLRYCRTLAYFFAPFVKGYGFCGLIMCASEKTIIAWLSCLMGPIMHRNEPLIACNSIKIAAIWKGVTLSEIDCFSCITALFDAKMRQITANSAIWWKMCIWKILLNLGGLSTICLKNGPYQTYLVWKWLI